MVQWHDEVVRDPGIFSSFPSALFASLLGCKMAAAAPSILAWSNHDQSRKKGSAGPGLLRNPPEGFSLSLIWPELRHAPILNQPFEKRNGMAKIDLAWL